MAGRSPTRRGPALRCHQPRPHYCEIAYTFSHINFLYKLSSFFLNHYGAAVVGLFRLESYIELDVSAKENIWWSCTVFAFLITAAKLSIFRQAPLDIVQQEHLGAALPFSTLFYHLTAKVHMSYRKHLGNLRVKIDVFAVFCAMYR